MSSMSVTEIAKAMAQAIQENRQHSLLVNQDENWLVQVQYTPGQQNVQFYAEYSYKSGQRDNTLVVVTVDGGVTQSNPAVKIRKDLIEKMATIVKDISIEIQRQPKEKIAGANVSASEVIAALIRHWKELPDNFALGEMSVEQIRAAGENFLNADRNSGAIAEANKGILSNTIVLEGEIVDYDMRIMEEVLKKLESEDIMVSDTVQDKIQAELSKPNISPNEIYAVLAKNLKYLISDFRAQNGLQDGRRDRSTFGTVKGYKLYNKSNKPFTYKLVDYSTCEVIGEKTVGPADNFYVSRAELALIGSQIEICNKIANGVIKQSSRKSKNKIEWIRTFIVQRDEKATDKNTTDIIQLKPDTWTRFMDFNVDYKKRQLERLLTLVFSQDRLLQRANDRLNQDNLNNSDKSTLFNMNAVIASFEQVGYGYQKVKAQTVANVNMRAEGYDNKGQVKKKGGLFGMFKR